MMRVVATAGLLVVLGATAGVAERNLIPTLDNEPDGCPDQPPEPQWLKEIDIRASHKRLLIQQIYRAQSMQRIVEAQSCECPTRYPSWKVAEGVFVEHFAASGTGTSWQRRPLTDGRQMSFGAKPCQSAKLLETGRVP